MISIIIRHISKIIIIHFILKKNFEITNGEQKFEIEDVEVFKVYAD